MACGNLAGQLETLTRYDMMSGELDLEKRIMQGANLNSPVHVGVWWWMPLHFGVEQSLSILRLMLQHKADPMPDYAGRTALDIAKEGGCIAASFFLEIAGGRHSHPRYGTTSDAV